MPSAIIRAWKTDFRSPDPSPPYPITLFNADSASAECSTTTIAPQPDNCRLSILDNTGNARARTGSKAASISPWSSQDLVDTISTCFESAPGSTWQPSATGRFGLGLLLEPRCQQIDSEWLFAVALHRIAS